MKKIFFAILMWLLACAVHAQSYTISGHITDKSTGENLIGAMVYEVSTHKYAFSNSYGFYSLTLNTGNHLLQCSLFGYKTDSLEIMLTENHILNITLDESHLNLEEVVVNGASSKVLTNEFNPEVLTISSIRQLPAIFGEADIIKAVQMQSGIKFIGDGSSGLLVRGGTNDQNLILIDEAPIYNASHLFGLISIFNPDAVNSVTLYKSNIPAQYGGRISSVINCMLNEGNAKKHKFSFSASPFAMAFTANGPIVKEKLTYLVSVRGNPITPFIQPNESFQMIPNFYDLNAKLSAHLGNSNRLFVSFYHGQDFLESYDGLHNRWGNISGTLRWIHNFGSRWFLNTTFVTSRYKNDLAFKQDNLQYSWKTGLKDFNLKADLNYYITSACELRMGIGSIYHQFMPGESDSNASSLPHVTALEHSIYVLNDWSPLKWLGLNYGLRMSVFQHLKGTSRTKVHLEPRVCTNFKLTDKMSVKAAYARNAQYMQVLQNSATNYTALETWFPAVNGLEPMLSNVVSVGWFQNFRYGLSASAEVYYKHGTNQIDYVDHARLTNNPNVLDEIRVGSSNTYGIELNVSRKIGKINGSVSYTFSRVKYHIAGINHNTPYPAISDMPHDVRIIVQYRFNPRWNVSASWIYLSGRPFTLPVGFYDSGNSFGAVPIYTDRNGARMPAYHRLDLSGGYTSPTYKSGLRWSSNVGIYNVYNHRNYIGYMFDYKQTNMGDNNISVEAYALFGILPNVSFRIFW